ncbi:MAG: glycosyltransferase family 2 protein [Candidatus Aminicenantes bacterium]|nr:glycosyltransferase family 2 protein [Candidatus Aminicenantes bacterium]
MIDNYVSVVIPAHNESDRIGEVLSVVLEAKAEGIVDEVIVVDDGSSDRTIDIVKNFHSVKSVAMSKNHGKGMAMYEGSRLARGKILLFLDADLKGLEVKHIGDLIRPVRQGKVDVTISLRDPSFLTWPYNVFGLNPVSGERAIKKLFFQKIPINSDTGYAIETMMNAFILKRGLRFLTVRTKGIKNSFKHKKDGFGGFWNDIKMYKKILKENPRHLSDWIKMIKRQCRGLKHQDIQ